MIETVEEFAAVDIITAVALLIVLMLCAGVLARRLVLLRRKDPRELRYPRVDLAFDLVMAGVGTYLTASVVDNTFRNGLVLQSWVDYLTAAVVIAVLVSIPVLAAACAVLGNRHLDGDGGGR